MVRCLDEVKYVRLLFVPCALGSCLVGAECKSHAYIGYVQSMWNPFLCPGIYNTLSKWMSSFSFISWKHWSKSRIWIGFLELESWFNLECLEKRAFTSLGSRKLSFVLHLIRHVMCLNHNTACWRKSFLKQATGELRILKRSGMTWSYHPCHVSVRIFQFLSCLVSVTRNYNMCMTISKTGHLQKSFTCTEVSLPKCQKQQSLHNVLFDVPKHNILVQIVL